MSTHDLLLLLRIPADAVCTHILLTKCSLLINISKIASSSARLIDVSDLIAFQTGHVFCFNEKMLQSITQA